ncbi:MAG: hypothetical protein MJZ38_00295 [archaeon]|nr:hypothetical protein [archaeon]
MKDRIEMDQVNRAGCIIATELDYDLQYDPEKGCFVPARDETYLLGIVEDSILFRKAEEFIRISGPDAFGPDRRGDVDIDSFFDFLERVRRCGLGKEWREFISPSFRDVGAEWAVASGLDPVVNVLVEKGASVPDIPDIPDIPCRRCGTVCTSSVDRDGVFSEVGGRKVHAVLAVCPSCDARYPLRLLNDGYEVGLHHAGDAHPFWTYARHDILAGGFQRDPSLGNELDLMLEDYHMRVHKDKRLKKIVSGFKGRNRSPDNPDYVKALCLANLRNVVASRPSELRNLSGKGLEGEFAALHMITVEDAMGYPGDPLEVLGRMETALKESAPWYRYFFRINYLLNYRMSPGKEEQVLDAVHGRLRELFLEHAEEVADVDCHDTCLKSLFCDLFEQLVPDGLPISRELLDIYGGMFCGATEYRGITAVVGLRLGLTLITEGRQDEGMSHIRHVYEIAREGREAGPFTVMRAAIAGLLVAAVDRDAESTINALGMATTLDKMVGLDPETMMGLMMSFARLMDMDKDEVVEQSTEQIRELAELLNGISLVEFT